MKFIAAILIGMVFFALPQAEAQILPAYGDSRTATTGWQFLKLNPDARAASMGESFIAVANDMAAIYWNPAGLTQLDSNKYHFQINYTDYAATTQLSYAAVAYRINNSTIIGAGLQYFDAGTMDVTTEFMPQGTGQTFGATDIGLGISLARQLTDAFSFGITAKYIREQLATVNTNNVVLDFGFQYLIGIANTRFAVDVSNFGFNTKPDGSIYSQSLFDTTTITDFKEIAVPTVFRLGFAWDAISTKQNLLTIAAQLNHPTDNNETYSLGVEYGWKHLFFVRTGYRFVTDNKSSPCFGFGLQLKKHFGTVKFDYAFNAESSLGIIQRIGFGLNL